MSIVEAAVAAFPACQTHVAGVSPSQRHAGAGDQAEAASTTGCFLLLARREEPTADELVAPSSLLEL